MILYLIHILISFRIKQPAIPAVSVLNLLSPKDIDIFSTGIIEYEKLLRSEGSDFKLQNQARFSLAQLAFIKEDYRKSVKYLLEWIEEEEEPSSQGYSLIATAYFQLEDFKKAKNFIEKAIEIASFSFV